MNRIYLILALLFAGDAVADYVLVLETDKELVVRADGCTPTTQSKPGTQA